MGHFSEVNTEEQTRKKERKKKWGKIVYDSGLPCVRRCNREKVYFIFRSSVFRADLQLHTQQVRCSSSSISDNGVIGYRVRIQYTQIIMIEVSLERTYPAEIVTEERNKRMLPSTGIS